MPTIQIDKGHRISLTCQSSKPVLHVKTKQKETMQNKKVVSNARVISDNMYATIYAELTSLQRTTL